MTAAAATAVSPTRLRGSLVPLAEVALAGVTLATVAGMWRLFEDGSYFPPLAAHAVAAHVVAATLRRRGVPVLLAVPATAACAAVALAWAHVGHTTRLGLPTGATLDEARLRIEEAWRLFGEVRAPAPVLPGFLLAAGAAVWATALLADVAAFRLWAPFEPLVPSATVFVFASLFAAERGRAAAAALWLAAALAFVLAHRTARQHDSPSWFGSDPRAGSRALLRAGAGIALAAVVLGWAAGPRLPGSSAEAIVAVRDLDDGGASRETISPLVEIKGRLVERSQAELFTVRSEQRAYWRLTALDEFDGEVWSSRGTFGRADGELAGTEDPALPVAEVAQRFEISGLAAIWLPAAFEPRAIRAEGAAVRWEAETSTLIVSEDHPTSDGLAYEVVSAVPVGITAEHLQGLAGDVPPEVQETGLALPEDFPATVVAEARRVVAEAGATTPYEQAMALQAYFRGGAFEYSLDVAASHSTSAIEHFLFVDRRGYCEQFAGTYAAMARAVGLPARVAVGFTPGEPDPTDPTLFRVRGEHAHAWPEVWIPGAGWLAFEPTPGRGAPGAPYTGVPEAQATSGDPTSATTATTAPATADPAPTTAPGGPTLPQDALGGTSGGTEEEGGRGPDVAGAALRVLTAAGALLAALAVAGAAVALARAARRWRRWATARTPEAVVAAAWVDAVEAAAVLGVPSHPHETAAEAAVRIDLATGGTEAAVLAALVEEAGFSPDGVDGEGAARARALAAAVRRAVRARTPARTRLLAAVDPRPAARRRARPAGPRLDVTTAPP